MKWRTMCSAPTWEGLEKLINEYFCSANYRIAEDDTTVINIGNGKKWDEADGYICMWCKGKEFEAQYNAEKYHDDNYKGKTLYETRHNKSTLYMG